MADAVVTEEAKAGACEHGSKAYVLGGRGGGHAFVTSILVLNCRLRGGSHHGSCRRRAYTIYLNKTPKPVQLQANSARAIIQ